ncbi:tetratricopeptide repeat protein [Maribacter sp. 2307ULW6-5]|uniref:tetratricopeptide repeat protein n=1 Tax=Maribacter sp. 2307ULW6-5 TaxID=3386275 RepID=UPI0039BD06E8
MRFFIFIVTFVAGLALSQGQEDFLAKQYFAEGDFERAVVFYEKLATKNPRRPDYVQGLVQCYQQLQRYADADAFLDKLLQLPRPHPNLYIEKGYNRALQDFPEEANALYDRALEGIDENPNFGYALGYQFQKYGLLDWAIAAYKRSMELNPALDYNVQLARIYGEQGNVEKMYRAYLDLISNGKTSRSNVLRSISEFISENAEDPNNLALKQVLLEKAQGTPDLVWNELLSWLFVQQQQYGSAFRQEKAIFKRTDGATIQRLENLAETALETGDTEMAKAIFEYVEENAVDNGTRLEAQLNLQDIALLDAGPKELQAIGERYGQLVERYGYGVGTLQLQVAYANFLAFRKDQPKPAAQLLKNSLDLPLNPRGMAFIKLALGDILVYDKKFNEALIYFSQVQQRLKNDVLGQNARYKVAETSFYKGDFKWALTQLKVLRGSTSQLIANDAMQLSLLISDNSLEDSTQTALKKYARADFLAYQKKDREAIAALEDILQQHKGEKIEDEALLKQAQLLEAQGKYAEAELNYRKITEFFGDGILADDAFFALGELYRKVLDQPEKAKAQYEKIIYNYQDSYYFPQARKQFRKLRGDAIN